MAVVWEMVNALVVCGLAYALFQNAPPGTAEGERQHVDGGVYDGHWVQSEKGLIKQGFVCSFHQPPKSAHFGMLYSIFRTYFTCYALDTAPLCIHDWKSVPRSADICSLASTYLLVMDLALRQRAMHCQKDLVVC